MLFVPYGIAWLVCCFTRFCVKGSHHRTYKQKAPTFLSSLQKTSFLCVLIVISLPDTFMKSNTIKGGKFLLLKTWSWFFCLWLQTLVNEENSVYYFCSSHNSYLRLYLCLTFFYLTKSSKTWKDTKSVLQHFALESS